MENVSELNFSHFILLTLLTLFLVKCANQQPPPGGEIDTTPPEIVESVPLNGTTNYSENYVEFTFSEYVDKRSVQDAFFISPNLEGEIEYDWSGKSVEIIFKDSLKENTTYIITIGSDVKDLNNSNDMARSFNLTFSTGNEIDFCSVEGKIYGNKPEGTMVFAYMMADTIPNPQTQKPNYLTQVGEDGIFKLLGMAPADYRIFAVKDEFKNLVYNIGEDRFATPYKDITLTKQDSLFTGLNFLTTIEDTLAPQISTVTMTDKHHFLVEFSERIDSSRITDENFHLFDSTANRKINVDYLYVGKKSGLEFFLSNVDTLTAENKNFLIAENIFDKAGNELVKETIEFVASTEVDTTAPGFKKVITEFDSDRMDNAAPYMIFQFNDAFGFDAVFDAFRITDPREDLIRYELESVDGASVKLIPEAPLPDDTEYTVTINLNKFIDAAGNKLDTTQTVKVSSISELEFSGVAGVLSHADTVNNKVLVLENLSDANRVYNFVIGRQNEYEIERVIPGSYFIWSYIDSNNDTTFNYGSINPFAFSERFVYYPDTLNLRARWPVGDIDFGFPADN